MTKGYVQGIRDEHISTLTGIDTYKAVGREVEKRLIGMETEDGIKITGFKTHFVDRLIGDYNDLKPDGSHKPRIGVSIDDAISTIQNPGSKKTYFDKGKPSKKYLGKKCDVTINPDTGMLLQTNP